MELTEEQLNIHKCMAAGHNVIVNAVAGSGKTSTIISFAERHNDTNILLITYNSSICDEVRQKCVNVPNIIVMNYHKLAYNFYGNQYLFDVGIETIRKQNISPIATFGVNITHIVIDEMQDMIKSYYLFVRKIIRDMQLENAAICCLGDVRQCIYEYKGSDSRYLTMADQLFDRPFVRLNLSQSFRITSAMCHFIVNHIFDDEVPYIKSNKKSGYKVNYYQTSADDDHVAKYVYDYIINLMKREPTLTYDDIYVLSDSTKGPSYNSRRFNHVVKIISSIREESLIVGTNNKDIKYMTNKIYCGTIHSVKGCERRVVIYLSFNNNGSSISLNTCDNKIYVGLTRASQILCVIECNYPYKFVRNISNNAYMKVVSDIEQKMALETNKVFEKKLEPSKLTESLSIEGANYADSLAARYIVRRDGKVGPVYYINDDIYYHNLGITENISKFVAQTFLDMFYYFECQIDVPWIAERFVNKPDTKITKDTFKKIYRKCFRATTNHMSSKESRCEFVNIYEHNYKHTSIEINKHNAYPVYERLCAELPTKCVEKEVELSYNKMTGFVDMICGDTLMELKYTKEITIDHKIQLMAYTYLAIRNNKHLKKYVLYNYRTNEYYDLIYDDNFCAEFETLLTFAQTMFPKSDNDFIKENLVSFVK